MKEKKEREEDTEDDTYVLWDDDECDPLALLMVDRKKQKFLRHDIVWSTYTNFTYNSQQCLNNKWSLKRVCEDSIPKYQATYTFTLAFKLYLKPYVLTTKRHPSHKSYTRNTWNIIALYKRINTQNSYIHDLSRVTLRYICCSISILSSILVFNL